MRADLERQKPARARAGQIRTGMRTYIETLGLIAVAYAEGDHLTLGYESWDAYLEGEFNHQRVQLDPAMREKAITELRLGGLSQRAIATTLGVGRQAVREHERQVDLPDPPGDQLGVDGKTYSPARSPLGATEPAAGGGAGTLPPATDHPGVNSSGASGEGAGSGPAPAAGGAASTMPPAAPQYPCEKCGGEMAQDVYDAGFTRCGDCDPEGEHQTCRSCGRPL